MTNQPTRRRGGMCSVFEHTWGAWCSVSDSENPFTKKQWDYKRDFAVKAESRSEAQSRILLPASDATAEGSSIHVHNTSS